MRKEGNGRAETERAANSYRAQRKGEMAYHCDEHLGGPFASWRDMAETVDAYIVEMTKPV